MKLRDPHLRQAVARCRHVRGDVRRHSAAGETSARLRRHRKIEALQMHMTDTECNCVFATRLELPLGFG